MYSTTTKRRTSKGSVKIKTSHGRLQLVFSYAGKRHYLSLGLPDTKANQKAAAAKAKMIEVDMAYDRFDPTLAKYKPQAALSTTIQDLPQALPQLDELWPKFLEWKRPQCSPSTMRFQYRVFTNYLNKLPTYDLHRASEMRDHALKTIPVKSAKRFITRLSACCNWAVSSGMIPENPFKGMANEIKIPKATSGNGLNEINSFSQSERDEILDALESNKACSKYARVKHSYYYPFVFFLFYTGCRFSEAIALRWKHIDVVDKITPSQRNCGCITFEQAVVESEAGRICKDGLKTQERRRFPVNRKMWEFLMTVKPLDATAKDLVFPSPMGKWIEPGNFRNRIWEPVLTKLKIEYRKPYQTRHTFITLALESGLDAKDVARLVGNTPEIIYRHYAGNKRELFVPEF